MHRKGDSQSKYSVIKYVSKSALMWWKGVQNLMEYPEKRMRSLKYSNAAETQLRLVSLREWSDMVWRPGQNRSWPAIQIHHQSLVVYSVILVNPWAQLLWRVLLVNANTRLAYNWQSFYPNRSDLTWWINMDNKWNVRGIDFDCRPYNRSR